MSAVVHSQIAWCITGPPPIIVVCSCNFALCTGNSDSPLPKSQVLLNIVDALFICYAIDRDRSLVTKTEVHEVFSQVRCSPVRVCPKNCAVRGHDPMSRCDVATSAPLSMVVDEARMHGATFKNNVLGLWCLQCRASLRPCADVCETATPNAFV